MIKNNRQYHEKKTMDTKTYSMYCNDDEFHSILMESKFNTHYFMLETIQSDDCNPQNNYKSFFSYTHTQIFLYILLYLQTYRCLCFLTATSTFYC